MLYLKYRNFSTKLIKRDISIWIEWVEFPFAPFESDMKLGTGKYSIRISDISAQPTAQKKKDEEIKMPKWSERKKLWKIWAEHVLQPFRGWGWHTLIRFALSSA